MSTAIAPVAGLIGMDQLSEILGISKPTIYRYRSEGKHDKLPPAIMIGSQVRWKLSTVESWLSDQEGKSADAA